MVNRSMDNIGILPEVNTALKKYKELKRQIKRERVRIRSLYKKYLFISMIDSKIVNDLVLENHVQQLFKDPNYDSQKPNSKKDLDVIVCLNSRTIGIEVKNGNLPTENDMFQARKYATRHLKANKKMHQIIVWNNAKTQQQFDTSRVEDAEGNNYGIITTKELLKGYLKVKLGKITLEEFDSIMNNIGLIKFSNSSLKKLNSSVHGIPSPQ